MKKLILSVLCLSGVSLVHSTDFLFSLGAGVLRGCTHRAMEHFIHNKPIQALGYCATIKVYQPLMRSHLEDKTPSFSDIAGFALGQTLAEGINYDTKNHLTFDWRLNSSQICAALYALGWIKDKAPF